MTYWIVGAVFGFEFVDDELLWVLHFGPLRIMRMAVTTDEDETSDSET